VLIVETYLNIVPGKGIGLFANEEIPAGATYWVRNEEFDRIYNPNDFNCLKKIAANYIAHYGFLEVSGNWYLCSDNARFSNHSENSNSKSIFDNNGIVLYCVATINIGIGQEILCDYKEICLTCKNGVTFNQIILI
jgi:SET domain-containing protein